MVIPILEGILKGLVLWIYGLILDGVNAMANALLDVFNMDLSYFEQYAPVTGDIMQIIIATGWALLMGNMAFQAMRSMAAGIGFEGEDPKILFTRTFVFGFLLVASRQICEIGLGVTGTVMGLMRIPDAVEINTPDESMLGAFDAAWIWMVIIGIILIWQIVKFFFEIGERYVVLAVLTIMAPLAFGMGGSKNTEDIFKGWARMYGSMCVMMLMNVVFLKLLLSAMSTVPTGAGIIPWLIFVVAIARVGRKVDDLVCRVGLNPARTGDPLGRGIPVMVSMMVAKNLGKTLAGTFAANRQNMGPSGGSAGAASGSPRPGPTGPAGSPGGAGGASRSAGTYASHGGPAAGQTAAAGAAMASTAAAGQAARTAGQGMEHAAGQGIGQQPQGQSTRQGTQAQNGAQPSSGQPLQGMASRPPRTKPVNIDVEYEETQVQPSAGAASPHGMVSPPGGPGAQAKTEQNPTRPPVQHTPRGNFPQPPVGAGAAPHTSHSSSQATSSTTSASSSRSTQATEAAGRPAVPHGPQFPGGAKIQGAGTQPTTAQNPTHPPLSGARSAGAGLDRGTTPSSASRPPIGHNAVINNIPQEQRLSSLGRDGAPQGAPTSGGRNGVAQSPLVAAQVAPPRPGRNGASAPQPLPPIQSADKGASQPPSPGRNGAQAPAQPSPPVQGTTQSADPAPSPGRKGAPQGAPPNGGRNGPQRPPIGHNRRPPGGDGS